MPLPFFIPFGIASSVGIRIDDGGIPMVAMASSRRRGLGEVVVSEVITTMCSARILPRIPILEECSDVCGIYHGQWPFAWMRAATEV
jgi:hypothetical protein